MMGCSRQVLVLVSVSLLLFLSFSCSEAFFFWRRTSNPAKEGEESATDNDGSHGATDRDGNLSREKIDVSGLKINKGNREGTCVSKGGRFAPYPFEGKPPANVARTKHDLTLCTAYRGRTCCGSFHTDMAMVSLRKIATAGEASEECTGLWEVLECTICNPSIGTAPGPPLLCRPLCDQIYSACQGAYFVSDSTAQVLTPCGPKDAVCARGSEWAKNGSDFCRLLGFHVKDPSIFSEADYKSGDGRERLDDSYSRRPCFDGKPSKSDMTRGSSARMYESKESAKRSKRRRNKTNADGSNSGTRTWEEKLLGDADESVTENAKWMAGGLLLAASIALLRWYSWRARRKRGIAALIAARNLQETRARQQASASQLIQRRSKAARTLEERNSRSSEESES